MPIYKGINIQESLAGIIRFMHGVEDYREGLGKLQSSWDVLVLLGQLTGAAAEMSGTREAFQALTGDLLTHLGEETRRKAVSDLRAKAQISIDILVRNLFERTADIGFLSADDDVQNFLEGNDGQRATLEARFQEYVKKYSVYSDIILFDARGHVRARLIADKLERSKHAVLDTVRSTSGSYVEYFGEADFLPSGEQLVYAYRVQSKSGEFLGTLALVFRLENEMQGVFANLLSVEDCTLLATMTQEGMVVATSSSIQLPVGTQLPENIIEANGDVVRFAGREFLAMTCSPHGYQGYSGPGWRSVGLIPLEYAFERINTTLLGNLEPDVLSAVMSHPTLFSDSLRQIPLQAERIQEDLNRSVWNGSVRQVEVGQGNAGFAKTLLWEISNTGRKTQAVFEESIGNLHQTVVAALLQQSTSQAAFAIDVMDRNLYERANDSRWWALNATFRRVLSGTVSAEDQRLCNEILSYINGLYTVYDSLILFDRQGVVVGVSKSDKANLLGTRLSGNWVERTLALSDTQGYMVSDFVPSQLYGNKETYIYAAAVQHPEDRAVVGGIGVVFDSQPQFSAMLHDALPVDQTDHPVKDAFALFLHRDGTIVSSADDRFKVGAKFPLEASLRHLSKGSRQSSILEYAGRYYALGVAVSAGYREYKTSDGHEDDVLALCAFPLGEAGAKGHAVKKSAASNSEARTRRLGTVGERVEIATFYVGKQWLGIPAVNVVEAIDITGITPAFGGNNPLVAGVKMYRGSLISVLHLQRLLVPDAPVTESSRQIIVLRTNDKVCFGLLVDELGEIPEVLKEEIQPMTMVANQANVLTVGVVQGLALEEGRHSTLSVLATDRLCCRLGCECKVNSVIASHH
ncbi:MAG: hypothetical protein RIR18_1028 [Pseudomonadota bacterium]